MKPDERSRLERTVASYYAGRLAEHGPTPRGADWRDAESQTLRFDKLAEILADAAPTDTIAEVGCGYGALALYLRERGYPQPYQGLDFSSEMVEAARRACAHLTDVTFTQGDLPAAPADYCLASGIFNVRLEIPEDLWRAHIEETLERMGRASRRGFAANFLTSWSDADRMAPHLHYADPGKVLNHCIGRFGRRVSLSHGYDLYEFSILVWH